MFDYLNVKNILKGDDSLIMSTFLATFQGDWDITDRTEREKTLPGGRQWMAIT